MFSSLLLQLEVKGILFSGLSLEMRNICIFIDFDFPLRGKVHNRRNFKNS